MRFVMKKCLWSACLLAASLAAATPAMAQSKPGLPRQAKLDAAYAHRQALIDKLVAKWSNHLQEVYRLDPTTWVTNMAAPFDLSSIDVLERAVAAPTFDAMNNILLRGEVGQPLLQRAATDATGQKLGDIAADLVFVPITPCRIIDTRLAGGTIPASTSRDFDVTGTTSYAAQGGSATDCNGAGNAGSFAAAVINFTVVSPTAPGYVTAYPYLAPFPLAATVNYVAGDIRGNLAIIKLDQSAATPELSVFTFATTHLVADLVGYLIEPQATELTCVDTADTVVSVAASAQANAVAPACSTGFTATATNCESDSWQMPLVWSSGGVCSGQNNSLAPVNLRASRTCCRVPGR